MKQYQSDDAGNTKYITADGNAVAQSKSVADMQSIELAKLQLAGLVQTNVSSLVDANLGNAQLSAADAASVTEIVQSSKNLIATRITSYNVCYTKLLRSPYRQNIARLGWILFYLGTETVYMRVDGMLIPFMTVSPYGIQ